jgi:hypothetical protein
VFGSQLLEVMIGLLLIYLALSVACSGIKEVIASLFALRSKTLEAGIRNMLQDANGNLAEKILEHPLISATAPPGKKLPSYISSRNFALALFDAVGPADGTTQPRSIQDLRAAVVSLPGTKLRMTLLGFIDSAQGDMEKAQARIESWFDDTMERVSGWYKRMAQKLIFGAAFLLCLALNADTFQIARELWSDQALSSAVVAQAAERVRDGGSLRPASGGSTNTPTAQAGTISEELRKVNEGVRAAQPLPLGWSHGASGVCGGIVCWLGGPLKFLGILVSSFAILMGAPFWFDLLNKVINLRITGDPPPQSH